MIIKLEYLIKFDSWEVSVELSTQSMRNSLEILELCSFGFNGAPLGIYA